jgi:hypothetical protein
MVLTLRREAHLADGTIGVLEVNGRKFPTLENRRDVTDRHDGCLPPGSYKLFPRQRASGEKAYAVANPMLGVWERPMEVPTHVTDARSAVYLAAGNTLDDLTGCHIAPGKQRVKRGHNWCLEGTREAMNEIRTLLGSTLDLMLIVEGPG